MTPEELMIPAEEIWKPVRGYEHYEVSNFGRVRKISYLRTWRCSKIHYPQLQLYETDGCGRRRVGSGDKGKSKKFFVHRLVAQAFVPNPDNLPCVNHKDGDKTNFSVSNLEWCTHSQNEQHAYDTGLMKPNTGHRKFSDPRSLVLRWVGKALYDAKGAGQILMFYENDKIILYLPKILGWANEKQRKQFYRDAERCGFRRRKGIKCEYFLPATREEYENYKAKQK